MNLCRAVSMFGWTLLCTLFFLHAGKGHAQPTSGSPELNLVSDVAGLFNERGYRRSNSFSVDGNEMINDFNGNLLWSRILDKLPITQNGVHFEFAITYNGSVGHTIRNAHGEACNPHNVENINAPEWILSINNYAVQTFNFENELTMFETNDDVSIDDDASLLINGYHNCYNFATSIYDSASYGAISILMGDGSLKQFYSIGHDYSYCNQLFPFLAVTGEYVTMNKDDRSRGYLDCSTGEFTLFQEDGIRVVFKYYRPQWNTTITYPPTQLIDSIVQFLPVRFLDHQGHSLSLSYDSLFSDWGATKRIPGHPLIRSAGPYTFDWNGLLAGRQSASVDLVLGGTRKYILAFTGRYRGIALDQPWSRGQVTELTDVVGTSTKFEYSFYRRSGTGFVHDCEMFHGTTQTFYSGRSFDILLSRLHLVFDPLGGQRHYSYYDDQASRWGTLGMGIFDTLNIDFTEGCSPEDYPCRKSRLYSTAGRDPYYNNMVVARRRLDTDSNILAFDSLSFDWSEPRNRGLLLNDIALSSRRFVAAHPDSLESATNSDFTYRQRAKPGPYAQDERDRGWETQLLDRKTYAMWSQSNLIEHLEQQWQGDTYLLGQSKLTRDGIITQTDYDYDFRGDVRDQDTINNIVSTTASDSWGIALVTEYDTNYWNIANGSSVYFNSLVTQNKQIRSGVTQSREALAYYSTGEADGFVGQLKSRAVYPIIRGVENDSISESYTYFTSISALCQRGMDFGALRKRLSPGGDSVVYHYSELVAPPPEYVTPFGPGTVYNPVMYKYQWRGDSIGWSNQRVFQGQGPFWYKAEEFTNQPPKILVDAVYLRDSCMKTVTATRNIAIGLTVMIDTIIMDQSPIQCYMTIPGTVGYCDWDGTGTYAAIQKNGVDVRRIECEFGRQEVEFTVNVDSGDIISALVYKASSHGEYYLAKFTHQTRSAHVDTVFDTTIVPTKIQCYQYVDGAGRLQKFVNPNGFVSEVKYDSLNRVEQVILPGNHEFSSPQFVYRLDNLMLPACEDFTCKANSQALDVSDSILKVADTLNCPTPHTCDTFSYKAIMTFHYDNLENFGFDSAFLNFHVLDSYREFPCHGDCENLRMYVRAAATGSTNYLCQNGFSEEFVTSIELNEGAVRLDAEQLMRWLREYGTCQVVLKGIWEGRYSANLIASSEYPDSTKRPLLEVYGRWYRERDSVYTIRYDYDDFLTDGDGIDIQTRTRLDYGSIASARQTRLDAFARPFRQDILAADSTLYSSAVTDFDYLDRTIKVTDPLSKRFATEYDHLNRVIATASPNEQGTSAYYVGHVYSIVTADTLGFPEDFNLADSQLTRTETTDENGHTTWEYADILGQVRLEKTTPDGLAYYSTFFDYDDLGNLTKIIKPKGDSVLYWYNSLGQLLKEWSSDYDTVTYTYDPDGNLIAKQDGAQRARSSANTKYKSYYLYDGINRLLESGEMTIIPSDTAFNPRRRFIFDQESSENSIGKVSVSYSVNTAGNYGEKYDYDPRGRIKKQTNVLEAQLDSLLLHGRFVYSLSGSAKIVEYTYNYADQITSITYPTGLVVTYEYDQFGRLWKVGDNALPAKYANLAYTRRNEMSQMVLGENLQTVDYGYNALYVVSIFGHGVC